MKNNKKLNLQNKHFMTHWKSFIVLIATLAILILGYKLFISGSKFEESISRKLFHSEKKISIKLSNDNIYTNGIDDILNDISKEITLPKELYISDNFEIFFNPDGTITSINALLYGKNKNDFTDSFLLSYDYNKSKKLKITLNKNVNAKYDKKYSISPLINSLNVIPLKYAISNCSENNFGISYSGKKELDPNTTEFVYIDSKGTTKEQTNPSASKITGYAISLFVPNKETFYSPIQYIAVDNLSTVDGNITEDLDRVDLLNINRKISKTLDDGTIELNFDDKTTFKLKCTGESPNPPSSAISKIYTLYKVDKNTNESVTLNDDVFSSTYVEDINLTFINENLGFLSSSYKRFARTPILYKTEDGGKTFKEIPMNRQLRELGLSDNSYIDFPYVRDGILYMKFKNKYAFYNNKVHENMSYTLCKSEDNGNTWSFVKFVNYSNNIESKNSTSKG